MTTLNREKLLELAKEAGFVAAPSGPVLFCEGAQLERFAALLSAQAELRESAAWMIEMHTGPMPLWLSGDDDSKGHFSPNPNRGIRFPTKASAQLFFDLLISTPRKERPIKLLDYSCYSITEHEWCNAASKPEPSQPASKDSEVAAATGKDAVELGGAPVSGDAQTKGQL